MKSIEKNIICNKRKAEGFSPKETITYLKTELDILKEIHQAELNKRREEREKAKEQAKTFKDEFSKLKNGGKE